MLPICFNALKVAEQTASHTHPNTSATTNAAAIMQTGTAAGEFKQRHKPVICLIRRRDRSTPHAGFLRPYQTPQNASSAPLKTFLIPAMSFKNPFVSVALA